MSRKAPKKRTLTPCHWAVLILAAANGLAARPALAQPAEDEARAEVREKLDRLIGPILTPETRLRIDPRRSKILMTKAPVTRVSITNPAIVEVTQYGPTEFELIGLSEGETTMTLWFDIGGGDTEILRYIIEVQRSDREPADYGDLERRINELFPNSYVQLIPVLDKLIVRGQARDAKEAAEIFSVLRGSQTDQAGTLLGPGSFINVGTVARPYATEEDLPAQNIINMLHVPGEMQVLLKVRVAELTRSAQRQGGANLIARFGDLTFNSLLGLQGAASAVLTTEEVFLSLDALKSNGYSKILAEPNLVTLSGRPASFIAGGEFAVPVVVGIGGAAAQTTNFRGFGTQLFFLPTVIDKDRIRLTVTPSFSTLNNANSVNGIPGLNTRAVTTTVDLREGQWLAIAGLIQDQQGGNKAGFPLLRDIPLFGTMFSRRTITREETELIVFVSPELVHPLEPEEMPLILPGMEVTEPGDWQFYLYGRIEGLPNWHTRSTVYPLWQERVLDRALKAHVEAALSPRFLQSQQYYMNGEFGFSQ